jgi:hypothetical protein
MTETPQTIIQKIEQSRNQIIRLYRSVPVNEILEPTLASGWSVKKLLSHISAWEWRCAALLAEAHDTNGPLLAEPDVAALNEEIQQERESWSWEEVEKDFRLAHQTLLETLKEMPTARFNDKVVLRTIARDTWQEYERFLPDLQQWHQQIIHRH